MDFIAAFWISLLFIIILSLGLLIDFILAIIYWDKWPKFFRSNLSKVSWSFKDVFIICIALFLILCAVDYLISISGIAAKETLKPVVGIISIIGKYGLCLWIILRFLNKKYKVGWKELGLLRQNMWKTSLKSFLFYLGFIPILAFLTYISIVFCNILGIVPEPHKLIEILTKEKSIGYILYLMFTAAFFAPMFEEFVFRGLIYQGLKKNVGIIRAVLISSALFSLLHFNAAQFLPVMGLGVLLCFIFEYTGSLVPSIVVHIINNGFFLGLFLLMKDSIQ